MCLCQFHSDPANGLWDQKQSAATSCNDVGGATVSSVFRMIPDLTYPVKVVVRLSVRSHTVICDKAISYPQQVVMSLPAANTL